MGESEATDCDGRAFAADPRWFLSPQFAGESGTAGFPMGPFRRLWHCEDVTDPHGGATLPRDIGVAELMECLECRKCTAVEVVKPALIHQGLEIFAEEAGLPRVYNPKKDWAVVEQKRVDEEMKRLNGL